MIEKNVMKTSEYEKSITFRAGCECGSNDHDATIDFEKDKEIPEMYFINFYKKIEWSCYWGNRNWYERQWKKVKAILTIIFKGYIEMEDSFIFRGDESVDSFIKALEEGKKHMKGANNDD